MSITLMAAAWELPIPSTEKMVLMCLCDYANDEGGNCWPAVPTLARKCSKSERTVQGALKSLEAMGYLTSSERRGTSNSFQLDPRKICTPAKSAPPQKTTQTPAESAPKPPRTTSNGLAIAKPTRAKGWPEIPDWVPAEPWNAWVEMRRRKGKAPTARAVKLTLEKLERWRAKGHDPGAVLDLATEQSWTGIWEPRDNGIPPRQTDLRPSAGSRGERPNRCLDMVLAAEAEIRAEENREPGWQAGPALRAIGQG